MVTIGFVEMHGINGGTGAAKFSCFCCYEEGESVACFKKVCHSLLIPFSEELQQPLLRNQRSYLEDAEEAERLGKPVRGVHYKSVWEKLPTGRP